MFARLNNAVLQALGVFEATVAFKLAEFVH